MKTSPLNIPTATYRLQFNKNFTFRHAAAIVPYLCSLGISHIYASPYFKAGPDSTHGYDVYDYNELNPEIGTRAEFDAFIQCLHAFEMGLITDFVPNHMSIRTPFNTWWMDVFENGQCSPYASHFDIDWHPVTETLHHRILLPILDEQYGRVLERGEITLEFEAGAFFVRYLQTRLPLDPCSYPTLLEPALEKLQLSEIGASVLDEIRSVLSALAHLPTHTEVDPVKVTERTREKEVIKGRLQRLCAGSNHVLEAIDATLKELNGHPGDTQSFDALDNLLNEQIYRLSYWRVASEEINYRRFFDINDLAAIRVELPQVFEETHRLLFELVDNGSINGIRVDHVDGLWNPREYLEKLVHREHSPKGSIYLAVEKILMGDETLRQDWPVHGTTGYEFANQVTALFIDESAEGSIDATYRGFVGVTPAFEELVYRNKQLVMRLALASEINMLARILNRLSNQNRLYRDFTLNALTTAVREVIASFPTYRTYIAFGEELAEGDRKAILSALSNAKRRNPGVEHSVFNFLGEILLQKFPENSTQMEREAYTHFVMKFQQCTGPVMAKGLEDTTFYIYNRLVALNEVGGNPIHFGSSVGAFVEQNRKRLQSHPHTLLATSTHDTKRSEDTRARSAAISEIPLRWRRMLRHYRALNRSFASEVGGERAPDSNEEYLLYQTILGTWPLDDSSEEACERYIARIQNYMIKAVKEAKVNSSWIQPNEEWEAAVRKFIAKTLQFKRGRFVKEFKTLAQQIAQLGAINSLTQLVLKCTAPGVPDIFQGNELWDFSLVDPDNRRPVDYEGRIKVMETLSKHSAAELFNQWQDGRIKMFVTRELLNYRRQNAPLFQFGDFNSIKTNGLFSGSCVAFTRTFEHKSMLVVAARLTKRVGFPPTGQKWNDTSLELSGESDGHFRNRTLKDIFTGNILNNTEESLQVADALKDLSVAVYVPF